MTPCCPLAERIEPLHTVSGQPVSDAHKHDGMIRGYVCGKVVLWYVNGRLTPLSETDWDLRRVAG